MTVDLNGELYIDRKARTNQGVQWNFVFNNDTSVQPDEVGLCSFDNPSWVATVDPPKAGATFGVSLTCGNFFSPYKLISIIPEGFAGRFFLVGTAACVTVGEPWKLGSTDHVGDAGPLMLNGEGGYNVFRHEYSLDDPGRSRAFVGGLKTFARHSIYQLGLTIPGNEIFGNVWGPEWETQ